MKRSVAILTGVLGLSSVSAAEAANLCYSTGPLENAVGNSSDFVFVKALNNNKTAKADVQVRAFSLNGTKISIFNQKIDNLPLSTSSFVVPSVGGTVQFEIQIKVSDTATPADVLLGVFGELVFGDLNPSHRLVHSELTKIPCANFGPPS